MPEIAWLLLAYGGVPSARVSTPERTDVTKMPQWVSLRLGILRNSPLVTLKEVY